MSSLSFPVCKMLLTRCVVTREILLCSAEDESPVLRDHDCCNRRACEGQWRREGCECACPFSVLTRSYWSTPVAAAWEVPVCVLAPQEVCMGQHTHPLSFPSWGRSCQSAPWTPEAPWVTCTQSSLLRFTESLLGSVIPHIL